MLWFTDKGSKAFTIILIPLMAFAQTAPPTAIQITSRIVYVDVVVRDSYGRIVRGLTEKDFRVSEDGKPQQIDFFRDHTNDPPPSLTETTNQDGSLSFSNVDPGGERGTAVNIILFDFFNTAPQDQTYARKQMIRFLENLPPGRQTALFVLGTRLVMLQSFTGSTDRLLAAAKAMNLETSSVQTVGAQQQSLDMADRFSAAVGRSASGLNPVLQQWIWAGGENVQRATDVTKTALDQISAAVSGHPRDEKIYTGLPTPSRFTAGQPSRSMNCHRQP